MTVVDYFWEVMKYIATTIFFFRALLSFALAQTTAHGRIVRPEFKAPSLLGNFAREDVVRHLTIYLPPGYDSVNDHYPVLYFLHGYTWNDSSTFAALQMDRLMDTAIARGITRPVILVLPDSDTKYKGSFYTNSLLTGNWSDYIGKDVVDYIDTHYRTLEDRDSRGIAGISMGGNGAIKMGMLYSDVFSAVYASSPASLDWSDGMKPSLPVFKTISKALKEKDIAKDFPAVLMVDLARTYSPDINKPPFYADMPAYYKNNRLIIDTITVKRWNKSLVYRMIDTHLSALRRLHAIKIEWGRNDEFAHIPITSLQFSKKLERYGIKHFAEEFLGGHDDKLGGVEGRFYSEMLPFFNRYLVFNSEARK